MTRASFDMREYWHVRDVALDYLPEIAQRLIPEGARNADFWAGVVPPGKGRYPGSYVIDLRTGHWAMLSGGVAMNDIIKLAAFVSGVPLAEGMRLTKKLVVVAQEVRISA